MLTKKVVFISAQPDIPYFHWQVEVMIHNFIKVGINPNWIEVLWATTGTSSPELVALANKYPCVRFFSYAKTVQDNFGYIPVLRPDVLEQHFSVFPNLRGETIFYHDSDIIFRQLPNFDSLNNDLFWYFSDTISYIGSDYIQSKGEDLFLEMCRITKVDPELVKANQSNSGGAQQLMKGLTSEYWKNVKQDCLALYRFMAARETEERARIVQEIAEEKQKLSSEIASNQVPLTEEWINAKMLEIDKKLKDYNPVQKWCADMWAVLWNGMKIGAQPRISSELSFSWGTSSIEEYEKHNIMHNAGVTSNENGTLFYKGEFINFDPFLADFSKIKKDSASGKYVEAILYAKEKRS